MPWLIGSKRHWRATAGPTPRLLTAPLLITAVPAVVDAVTNPEERLAELILAHELVGGVASYVGSARISWRLPGAAWEGTAARDALSSENSKLLCPTSYQC